MAGLDSRLVVAAVEEEVEVTGRAEEEMVEVVVVREYAESEF